MYNEIIIPKKMWDILNQDMEWLAKTQTAINKINIYLSNTEMYFFPEYTNHQLKHINNVFDIVDKLVPLDSLKKLSSKDLALFILSVYIHDLGMLLKPDGLKEILSQEIWNNKFESFIKVASRMSDIELKNIYGDSKLFVRPVSLDQSLELTERDKLTYGEFLRRNHADIAEYIAYYGFPGKTNLDIFGEFEEEHRKIIGLIAKSHGISVRAAAEESNNRLIGKKNTYRPSNVPIIYLMVLLRMGDILDIGKDRSPHIIYGMKEFNSPISKEEWEWNQTIDSSNFNWSIAKTLYIQSEPSNTMQFINVEKNLKWFQTELDFSWAILCDCYGEEFNLAIHRIESNIFEQPELFKSKFLTKEAKIKMTSNLSKLLVDPLYHGDPRFAVRELLQNSMDACNMRNKVEKANDTLFKGKIEINIDTNNMVFSIKDNGIGMNEDIIVNYYLTVGANFRNSDYWEKATIDENDTDNIVRVGRFGVGFLATFLLGDEIKVVTRHLNDEQGYKFSVTLEDENISAECIEDVEIGTEIRVTMKKNINKFWKYQKYKIFDKYRYSDSKKILWNEWYHGSNPEVLYFIDNNAVEQELNFKIPFEKEQKNNWKNFKSNQFDKISYGFFAVSDQNIAETSFLGDCNLLSSVVVNGFLISEEIKFKKVWGLPGDIVICSIVDDKNLLQLDLSRTNLDYKHKIFELINIEIWKWQLARLLFCNVPLVKRKKGKNQMLSKYDFKSDIPDGLLYKKDSFSFLHPYFINRLFLEKFYMLKKPIDNSNKDIHIQAKILDSNFPLLFYSNKNYKEIFVDLYGKINSKYDHLFELVDFSNVNPKCNSAFMDFIDNMFTDVTDLWIPFDFNKRKNKFQRAFRLLSNYIIDN